MTDEDEGMAWAEVRPDDDYSCLCIWSGTIVEQEDVDSGQVDEFFGKAMKCEHPIRPVGCVYTVPDRDGGQIVKDTGGRCDFVFYVHNEDVMRFAVPRLNYGIRWWDDVVSNKSHIIYPAKFRKAFKDVMA